MQIIRLNNYKHSLCIRIIGFFVRYWYATVTVIPFSFSYVPMAWFASI